MSITRQVTLAIPLARISTGERLRAVDPDFVDLLAASMEERGLITPIEVGGEDGEGVHALIAGAHRLEAARKLGWATIDARVFDGDAIAVRLREIDENLCRHELSDLDRGAFLAERKVLHETLHPAAAHGGKRDKKASRQLGDLTKRFSAEAAEKVGLSERTIQRLVRRHDALHPDVRRKLAGTPFAWSGVDLDALAALPHAEQLRAMEIIAERGCTRVSAALEVMRGPRERVDEEEIRFARFVKFWADSSVAGKVRISAFVRAEMAKNRKTGAAA